ncbi:guanylate kinase [Paenibacillus mendelii]|uniref:Guanylate kinase n=1 Tax=Paenibacillus mendelii TaxID=206163 RepID=A0ABV6JCV3_9BACL|nr:guanylate kinase [Paenibacillus mendelii]MCQ6562527.1 guanylate kinase [Paenibacillus mendelii]
MAGPFIFIFTGTSGSGGQTIAHRIGSELGTPYIRLCTTHSPYGQEGREQDYEYISQEVFDALEQDGEFVLTATIHEERYGILRKELEKPLREGRHVYLNLDRNGASALKKRYGERVVRLFLYVDKLTLRERLEANGEAEDSIGSYLAQHAEEFEYRKQCEHVIEIDQMELNRTLGQIRTALQSHL